MQQAFKQAVGRSYRVVDRLDVVPALPPFDGYVHLDYSMWIQVCMPALLTIFAVILCRALPQVGGAAWLPCVAPNTLR